MCWPNALLKQICVSRTIFNLMGGPIRLKIVRDTNQNTNFYLARVARTNAIFTLCARDHAFSRLDARDGGASALIKV